MSDDKIKLTQEQLDKVKSWLEAKMDGDLVCPLCKKEDWQILSHILATMVSDERNIYTNPSYPSVGIICKNCGYMMQFNAKIIGMEKKPEGKDG